MPIEYLNTDAYAVKELTLGTDSLGCYISLVCAKATAYVLCFSAGDPVGIQDLSLSEEELFQLHEGGSLERDTFRLQGVRKQVFDAMPVFRGFRTSPPEQIQVWSMAVRSAGEVVLYATEDKKAQTCFVPMRYMVRYEPGKPLRGSEEQVGFLTVRLEGGGKYTDGALLYQVGECLPIPLPGSLLEVPIPLRVTPGSVVKVVVDERFKGKYESAV